MSVGGNSCIGITYYDIGVFSLSCVFEKLCVQYLALLLVVEQGVHNDEVPVRERDISIRQLNWREHRM